ncbi:carboxymethylenebutenolidase [Tepidicaulis marinus]|jgi:carboxymethylenebutenolidase|uniref:Carboxymethylenebutenolidase n=1 Tax=Tepidicaulis marinus TaxID=1333998 RepID=A0A081B6N5_9HYPH|nr:dienelactone hydrolase family protein [Tepidicaulis marinus]GAK43703.1 carboxymethylenebutenolidase [Tepidicaulis marinus]
MPGNFLPGQDVTIKGPDGDFSGYLSVPKSGSGPGIVVIQEIFGVNQVMRDITEWLADQGYVALCPDLFWRIEPGIQITDKTDEEWKQAFDLFGKFDVDKGVTDIQAAIDHLRGLDACTGKVGAVGYCLGGQLAYLTAARTNADAAVGYYGVNIQNLLGEAKNIKKPLALHVAGKDEFVPKEAQEQIIAGLQDHPEVTLYTYPERDHAFAREGGAHYHPADAKTANTRTLDFFKKNLG